MNAPTTRTRKQCPYAAAERQVTLRILSRMAADIDTLRDCPSFAGNYADELVDRLRDAFLTLREHVEVDVMLDSLTV